MTRQQALNWAVQNLPHWPSTDKPSAPDTRPNGWTWHRIDDLTGKHRECNGYYLVSLETGESICDTEYYSTKNKPCGLSFGELMENLKC